MIKGCVEDLNHRIRDNLIARVTDCVCNWNMEWQDIFSHCILKETHFDDVINEIQLEFMEKFPQETTSIINLEAQSRFLFAKWDYYKTVYRIDPSFFYELSDTNDLIFHQKILKRLPVPCFFIASPKTGFIGSFVYIEHVVDETLFLVVTVSDILGNNIFHGNDSLWIKDGQNLSEALRDWYSKCNTNITDKRLDEAFFTLKSAIQATYFLAAENCQIDEVVPLPKRKKKDLLESEIRQWDVSYRTGNNFPDRNFPNKELLYSDIDLDTVKTISQHVRPRPHLRRAHWHHYWAGPGKSQLVLRWIAPVLVNAIDEKALVPTEHKTKDYI